MSKKVSFHTLGCKLNFSETSSIAKEFQLKGYETVPYGEKSDVVVLNTCTVTGTADKKCRSAVKKALRVSPNAFVAVTGCYAQLQAKQISEIPGVDAVLGANDKFKIFEHFKSFEKKAQVSVYSCDIDEVTQFEAAHSSLGRTRSFLKVQDGCNYPCTYCTIPKARGKSRSGTIAQTLEQARKTVTEGHKEIILTGVNIGDFGRGTTENFYQFLQQLVTVNGIERIRISSIEPNLLKNEIIDFASLNSKVMPHFHVPLQSGSNKILQLMKRRYNRELFEHKVLKIKELQPNAFIGVDVIVGFPGETVADFQDTYNFIEQLDVSFLHVFSYSERADTYAVKLKGKVPLREIHERSKNLQALSAKKHKAFYEANINKIHKVLFEYSENQGNMFGFTENYIKIETPYNKELANTIQNVKITGIATSGNATVKLL